jgi:hypothetical protein
MADGLCATGFASALLNHCLCKGGISMKGFVSISAMILLITAAMAPAQTATKSSDKPQLVLKYGDEKPDGKKSIAGTGEMVHFVLPATSQKLRGLRMHCGRYGTPQAPNEDVEISIVTDDEASVVHTELVPYSKFKRGESRWTTVEFKSNVEVPEKFWVILDFNAEQSKGVYLSFDTSTQGQHSKTGVPGGQSKSVNTGGDWMVQALLSRPE